jgi:hypothetical protein
MTLLGRKAWYGDLETPFLERETGFCFSEEGRREVKMFFCFSFVILLTILISPNIASAGEIITALEIQSCFYKDGKMDCSKGEFKITYYRDGDKIVRTNVFNFKKKESISDNTVYRVIGDLFSDPRNNPGHLPQVTRALGFPGMDAMEILAIEKGYMQAVKSTSNYFVISRFKIVRE